LGPEDRVSIVTYAGRAAKLLDPTDDVARIEEAINSLCAGGSTAGADGLQLAYDAARAAYIDGGINRIMLTTDGDFNVGVTGDDALVDIVAREAETGVSLTTLGFGTGNFNEAMMEQVADRGNGNYAYIDGMAEAQKVLSEELESTLFTIASDVKIQVEWNPATVAEYRLIGYENRALAEEDFANDAVDAGEIGAGHDVTALYEIALVGSKGTRLPPRRYGNADAAVGADRSADELGELRLRYKLPDEETSRLIRQVMPASMARTADRAAGDIALAAAAAAFGQKLSDPRYLNGATYDDIAAMIDPDLPYARQFRSLVRIAGGLAPQGKPAAADE
ncbi:MAG: YfbK domain-containing protein, partial [Pseudomonadota bacterium]